MTAPHDVLRYWLSIIRREEALTSAIRAAPPVRREPSVDLRNPGRGQTYFKLGLLSDPDVPALCLREQSTLDISLQGDRMLFFEHWLRRRYISRRSDDDGPQVMLGFPVIYQPRRGELSTLLRFPMESIIWKDATQQQWTAPLPRDLRSSVALVPPMSLTLRTDGRPEGLPKFSVDELAATRLLGISEEQIPWLQVSTEDTLARMCALLTAAPDTPTEEIFPEQTTDESDADATMRVLLQKISSRLDSSLGRVFPVALVYDASTAFTTHHLQRELRDILEGRVDWDSSDSLKHYLGGTSPPRIRGLHIGCRGPHALTSDQRLVADYSTASPLTIAQGPPGTGKTELILNMSAHALCESLDPDDVCAGLKLLVCSTNNRAVDNVMDPLSEGSLPFVLRVGSRRVMEQVTLPTIERAIRWLREPREAVDTGSDRAQFMAAMSAMSPIRTELLAAAHDQALRKTAPERKKQSKEALKGMPAKICDLDTLEEVVRSLRLFAARLAAWLDRPKRTAESWRKLVSLWPEAAEAVLLLADCPISDVGDVHPDELDDAVDDALETLRVHLASARERKVLEDRIEECDALMSASPRDLTSIRADFEKMRMLHEPGLYEKGLRIRESWALQHRERLARTCADAAEALRVRRSFRNLPEHVLLDLQTLFPVWGCTLLSLGNALPFRPDIAQQVVIDEAGQCHPAYAISALMRGSRCLLIGDEHQLEPVINLDRSEEERMLRRLGRPEIEPMYRTTSVDANSAIRLGARTWASIPTLRDHFRCHHDIIAVSDRLCSYGLKTHTELTPAMHPLLAEAVVGYDIRGRQSAYLGSWKNDAEVGVVCDLVRTLISSGISPGRIAVLTPYRGQLRALDDGLRRAGVPLYDVTAPDARGDEQAMLFEVPTECVVTGTVHRFQGGEREIVLFSSVVSESRSLPFLNQRANLLNVAVSRAKRHFVLLGSKDTLQQGKLTAVLVQSVKHWAPHNRSS